MTKNQKRLARIVISAVALLLAWWLQPTQPVVRFLVYGLIYLLIGGDVIKKAFGNILRKDVFDENFLMSIATIGAFFINQYVEGIAVMLFYQVGELFQSYAVNQSRRSISKLLEIRPDYANIEKNGQLEKVDPEMVEVGEEIVIQPGERVPLDGNVISGKSALDTSALTGETLPQTIQIGDEILSGCINQSGILRVKVTKEFGDSTLSKILDLVENASSKKSQSENFIRLFARYYTPLVVFLAIFLAIIPPFLLQLGSFQTWLYRALTFLVISCPCALVVSIPLSFFGGIGGASKLGILVKGGNYLETLAKVNTVVFDKTGTLTKGVFKVVKIVPANSLPQDELLKFAAYIESYSTHPIASSLKSAYGQEVDQTKVTNIEEIAGHGIKGQVLGHEVLAGNQQLMEQVGIKSRQPKEVGTIVHIAIDNLYQGYIVIADELKADSKQAIQALKHAGVHKLVMLTGDSKVVGESVGKELQLDEVYSQLLPADKVKQVERLLAEQKQGSLAFVGDGINDAPVLARADIGIAMGGLGSDAAIEAADVVLMNDAPKSIALGIKIARKTLRIARQNIIFTLFVKALFLILGALGFTTMGWAVFADVGVTVLAVLNASRCLNTRKIDR